MNTELETKNTKKNLFVIIKLLEVLFHVFLLVGVPVIYLYITTGFNKYSLPDYSIHVYVYWLIYLIVIPVFYSLIKSSK